MRRRPGFGWVEIIPEALARPPFSPCGRRWPEGPDEGDLNGRRRSWTHHPPLRGTFTHKGRREVVYGRLAGVFCERRYPFIRPGRSKLAALGDGDLGRGLPAAGAQRLDLLDDVTRQPHRGEVVDLLGSDEDAHLAARLDGSRASHVVYSSCNVDTLARDLAAMPGLRPVEGRVVDMFPQTRHVETVLLLRRTRAGAPLS